ncbi:MAG: pyruvate, phosphate dikinase [Bdellovibrionales bacterium RIFOXYD12_FULL_39_22]|nr:MAG: pyruvate, phosphate dikinase [Bdellovibrionales bacterium RIFOXYB1_FULL_39_21]OFZ42585.1 MAG: pyruvate, phosphate dikinase [Bdellovibrionales bacterium RIFOXYC12_FULL_39_17]OFZ47147.1 MAG: pyruvate, phosphate dikinase [Bdellovibrionales bacterium RIFOXYC1_FULL_39_130]OFZ75395.1 MAG: pyruvate, phosphate dikinase [Bdellovibrionales bacterium RIFOXYD1_FULL_39_84]OFZ93346.1 MAG: pyruvate, phosphate dikinase [Bdellovibrionales bacterium RIFOXYD12_FULL_39_22]HLE09978.1 pyruvate, phosphate di
MSKHVYFFGAGKAEGKSAMKNLLGGKGANLAEMTNIGINVPAGFTITTEVCTLYYKNKRQYPKELRAQVDLALKKVEKIMGKKFGDEENPLLLSVRSGARSSMPGMMETVLNIGLTSKTIPALAKKTNNERFVFDAYRRLLMMYSDVVMEKAAGIEPADGEGIRPKLEQAMDRLKKSKGYKSDGEMTASDLKKLCEEFKKIISATLGKDFPDDASAQLWGGISAVFQSWMGKRAVSYRKIEKIPQEWGTAVNVQSMVFGNTGENSATGVAFTRNPATGENKFFGEWLANAQGEDVVAGIRTPNPINKTGKTADTGHLLSLEEAMPKIYKELFTIQRKLEGHYKDMQDIEFTIEEGKLWMLQTRVGKRNGHAAVRMAVEMAKAGLITKKIALSRVRPEQIDELLHPSVAPEAEKKASELAKGLPAGPGGAMGRVVFTSEDAENWAKRGEKVVLVREETSPEDVHGMHVAEAILTAKGGMTSHAALVARGWGKCCIIGCSALHINARNKEILINGKVLHEGDWLTLNGTTGHVYEGQLDLLPADPDSNKRYKELMKWADQTRSLRVRTNADTPADAALARKFGAEGIGLCRTEHMFFGPERIRAVREMILSDSLDGRKRALAKLLPFQKADFLGIFKAMAGFPVNIRLLDPPLHEFLPYTEAELRELSREMGVSYERLEAKNKSLHEFNPMLGHRGCRLGVTYPEMYEMQVQAIMEAACELAVKKVKVIPEIMIPLVGNANELARMRELVIAIAEQVQKKYKKKVAYTVGTMIELPRACMVADEIAKFADFYSFGTNDLTQTVHGLSRDDAGKFLSFYLENGVLKDDPFITIDQEGVGGFMKMAAEKGRKVKKDMKMGICGEHGGEPRSIEFCHNLGLNYVSCSPFRVPIARLAAAQAVKKG